VSGVGGLRWGAATGGVPGGGRGVGRPVSAWAGSGEAIPSKRGIRGGFGETEIAWEEESAAGSLHESAEKYGKELSSKTTCLDTITRHEFK
jgi:hypothetical protein